MNEKPTSLMMTRHLEDDDNLYNFRNGPILPDQTEKIELLAESIRNKAEGSNARIVVFFTSGKIRTVETAEELVAELRNNSKLKTIISSVDNLNEGSQGEVIIPEDYKPGDHFEGLAIANKVFRDETFGSEGKEPDPDYKFGDPNDSNGKMKYPELKEYISEPGESYREILYRLLSSIKDFSNELPRYKGEVLPVLISHSQIYQILIDLISITQDVIDQKIDIKSLDIVSECWERYQDRKNQPIPSGVFTTDISILTDEKVQYALGYFLSSLE